MTELEKILYYEEFNCWLTSTWGYIATRHSLTISDKERIFMNQINKRKKTQNK